MSTIYDNQSNPQTPETSRPIDDAAEAAHRRMYALNQLLGSTLAHEPAPEVAIATTALSSTVRPPETDQVFDGRLSDAEIVAFQPPLDAAALAVPSAQTRSYLDAIQETIR